MPIYLTSVSDAGAYEDAGVVVVGFRFSSEGPVEYIVLQIAGPDIEVPGMLPEDVGIFIEINDQGFGRYRAVSDFVFDRVGNLIRFFLDHPDFPDMTDIRIKIPDTMSEDEKSLIERMARLAGSAVR